MAWDYRTSNVLELVKAFFSHENKSTSVYLKTRQTTSQLENLAFLPSLTLLVMPDIFISLGLK